MAAPNRDFRDRSVEPLEIAEPPDVAAAFLQGGIPAAQRIGDEDNGKPDQVDDGEAIAEAGRELVGWAAKGRRRKQEKRLAAVVKEIDGDIDNVGKADVEEKKEKRHASEDDEGIGPGEIEFFKIGEGDECRAERHKQKEKRWRIFGGIEEREKTEKRGFLVRPVRRITIVIQAAKNHEKDGAGCAGRDQEFAAPRRVPAKNVAETIACCHDEDPGDQRIGDDEEPALKREPRRLMKDVPQECETPETRGVDAIEQIVGGDDEKTQGCENANG